MGTRERLFRVERPARTKARFLEQAEQKRGPDDPPHPIDDDFIKALAFGMPPMGGMGMGIDRLAMLMTDSATIREVIAFRPCVRLLRKKLSPHLYVAARLQAVACS